MEPKRLSASSIQVFEECQAGYKARMIEYAPEISTAAAIRGNVVHGALERYVSEDYYRYEDNLKTLERLCREEYAKLFSDDSELKACLNFCRTWYARQDWSGREVLSTESKEYFNLTYKWNEYDDNGLVTAEHDACIDVTYIWDRCDRLTDGSIEVVDYKTVSQPVSPDDMRVRIQPRLYGLAAQLKYPDAERIWVTYDLLRYEQVGVVFTKDDNRDTYRYLQSVAKRIRESDGSIETLNPSCRWCVRKATCKTLQSNITVGGIMAISSPDEAASLRMDLDAQKGAVVNLMAEVDEYLLEHMEREDVTDITTPTAQVKVTASGRRVVDSQRVTSVVGAEIAARYGKLTLESVKQILDEEELDENQRSQINQAIKKQFGDARIKVTPLAADEEI